MKKTIAIVMVLTMVFAFASSAMAVGSRFDIVTSNTSSLVTGASGITKTGNAWFVRYNENTSNITATHRAVVRIHRGTQPITPTWVYDKPYELNRPYYPGYTTTVDGVSFRARLDDRDSGTLEFHGYFYHSY
ncbi:MAG: hypothetical protein RSD94_08810 [Acinetobacter sp.]